MGYFEFGALLNETGLLNDLDGEDLLGLIADEFVAASEATLAQKVALGVLSYGVGLKAMVLYHKQIFVC